MPALEWRLPGPSRFARALAADLQEGRSAIVILPREATPAGLQGAVREFWPEIGVNRLYLREMLNGRRPAVDALFELLTLRRPDSSGRLEVGDFAEHPELDRRLIWVDGAGATVSQATAWGMFLRQYVSAATVVDVHRRPVFATLCPGAHGAAMPNPDQLLTKHWWWGVVTPLDTEVFVAELLQGNRTRPAFVETVTEVAGYDLGVARMLADEWDGSLRNLGGLLNRYKLGAAGADRVWSPDPSPRSRPPNRTVEAWAEGLVNAWGEHDPHSHPCHRQATEPESLRHLIWRGQVRGLLPRIEIERQGLAEWIYQRRDWLPPWWAGRDIRSLEVSELARIFDVPEFKRDRDRAALARWLRWSRNQIAHLKILDAAELKYAQNILERQP